jgi:pimeloyl-ACP methyl ester carboxylesterase
MTAKRPRTVLLVHGAWHGAWCWDRLVPRLRSLGYRPMTIDLPGHGSSEAPPGDLHGDADAVVAALESIGEPTLLVGHSYGGMVISDAGVHDAVCGLVYVCAFMPDAGQSLLDTSAAAPRPEGAEESELVASTRFTDDGSAMFLQGDRVVSSLFADCTPRDQRWALERLDRQPTASFTQVPRRLAWPSKPTTYIVCSEDRTIPPWHQRLMAERADRVVELRASHSPFLSMPDGLADALDVAARAVVSG